MAQQIINVGTTADDHTGDTLRAGAGKINANFTELYAAIAAGDPELIRDTIGAALVAGAGITITVDDAANTITLAIDTTTEAERIRDVIAAALVAGTNVSITPNDGADTITIAASGGGSYTDENARDAIGAALVAGSGITITVNDAGDTITIAATGGGGASSAPAIRSSNLVKYASAASFSHPLPTDAAAGDFCVIFYAGGFGDANITSPATAIWDTFKQAGTNWGGTVFCRMLTAADITAGSVTITPSGSFDAVVGAVCFSGEGKLRFPVLEQSARATAVHAPGAGATSSTQETPYIPSTDCVLAFLSNRGSSTNTSSYGSSLQTTTNANGSAALYANASPSAGGQSATFSYSSAGTGRFELLLAVRGPN